MTGRVRVAEAFEGVGQLRAEIDQWVVTTERRGPPGAHLTQLTSLRALLQPALDAVAAMLHPAEVALLDLPASYALARVVDRRVLFCRRLFRWYALRFDQRADAGLAACLTGADEVVWSVWSRTHEAARVPAGPAPLCFVDNDPIPWASLHNLLPLEARPSSRDDFFTERVASLPIPVVGLPPIVARRPWWLVAAIHETGHHVQHTLGGGVVEAVAEAAAAAAAAAGADVDERGRWADWSGELFADAFAVSFVGGASVWAIEELERAAPDVLAERPTYPPALVRLHAAAESVEASGAARPQFDLGTTVDPAPVEPLLRRVPHVVGAILDFGLGRTSLRVLAGDGRRATERRNLWAQQLSAGRAVAARTESAAVECIGGAVVAWQRGNAEAAALREHVLAVLPGCRPDGTRAAAPGSLATRQKALIDAVFAVGDEPVTVGAGT